MAIKIIGNTVIDDSRNITNIVTAGIGNSTVNVSVNSTAFVGNVIATAISGNLTGNVSATTITASANMVVGTLLVANTTVINATHLGGKTEGTLNVNAASQLITARNIGDVSFNGTAAIVPERITYKDTRATNFDPYTYPGVAIHLKENTADGLSDGGTYHTLLSLTKYVNSTGGLDHQLALTDNNNIYVRASTNSTNWGSWKQVLTAGAVSGITTLAAGNTTITGFVNATSSVNADSLSVGTNFIANGTVFISNSGMIDSVNATRIVSPGGGSYISTSSPVTGAIKIKLPVAKNNSSTMIRMTVRIFNYVDGGSQTLEIAGYNYSTGNWYSCTAINLIDTGGKNLNVRFGYDTTSDCIWIGETNTSWSYPQVYITDVQVGYSNYDSDWSKGWAVSIVSAFDTVEVTRAALYYQSVAGMAAASVNAATYATYLNGKLEGNLNVNNATYASYATYLNGKAEGNLNVNAAYYATVASNYLPLAGGTLSGDLNVNAASADPASAGGTGTYISASGYASFGRSAAVFMRGGRNSSDGAMLVFHRDGTTVGTISVAAGVMTYGTFTGSHWSQLIDNSKPDLLIGTVVETIDEKCVWPEDGLENVQLAKFKVSDTPASKAVYGVFMGWDNPNDFETQNDTGDALIVGLGTYLVRMAPGQQPIIGDLVESNGDGCARVQADDLIRSSTIGKITCTDVTYQYDDGSFAIPCVLYCG